MTIEKAPLVIRRSALARRMSIRLDTRRRRFVLTLPRGVSTAEGMTFARSEAAWMTRALEQMPGRLPFAAGVEMPYLGVNHRLRHDPARPAGVAILADAEGSPEMVVGGPEAGLEVRVRNWLRKAARLEIERRVDHYAARLGVRYHGIRMGDPKSRWGSCSAGGNLSFSWRLIMAPPEVIDYVAAHEVAHLKEMNHGPAFWAIVAELVPDFPKSRRWLKAHSGKLAHYGSLGLMTSGL